MGDANNPYVPFQISYITEPIPGYTQHDPPTVPCNKAVNVSIKLIWYKQISYVDNEKFSVKTNIN